MPKEDVPDPAADENSSWKESMYVADLLNDLSSIEDKNQTMTIDGFTISVREAIIGLQTGSVEGRLFYDLDPGKVGKVLDEILETQERSMSSLARIGRNIRKWLGAVD